jgi:hypothetical protein
MQGSSCAAWSLGTHCAGWAHTRRLSSVRRTATPASTLPTVRETSIVSGVCLNCVWKRSVYWSSALVPDYLAGRSSAEISIRTTIPSLLLNAPSPPLAWQHLGRSRPCLTCPTRLLHRQVCVANQNLHSKSSVEYYQWRPYVA